MLFALFYANSKAENIIEDFKEPLTYIKMSHSKLLLLYEIDCVSLYPDSATNVN
jgi:hypothetical protein